MTTRFVKPAPALPVFCLFSGMLGLIHCAAPAGGGHASGGGQFLLIPLLVVFLIIYVFIYQIVIIWGIVLSIPIVSEANHISKWRALFSLLLLDICVLIIAVPVKMLF